MDNKMISVIIPCYNEFENIENMYVRLKNTLNKLDADYEIIFINNGSYDNSQELFKRLTDNDKKVVVIELSRNFGSSSPAYACGLEYCSGDCVVMIDGDVQDPPELIEQFYEKWLQGYDIVYGIRKKRKDKNLVRKAGYKLFYRIYHHLSYLNMPLDAGDFALMDRRVVKVINNMPESNRIVRGLRVYAGFKSTGIEYTRDERKNGTTKYSFSEYIRIAKTGLITFSYAPLEYISHIAFIVTIIAFIAAIFEIISHFVYPNAPQGFSTLIVTILFLGSLQLLCLSVIGEYLAKIFDESKRRPQYIVEKILNDKNSDSDWVINGINTTKIKR